MADLLEAEKKKTAEVMNEFRSQKDALEKRYGAFTSAVEERIPQGELRCVEEKHAIGRCYSEYTDQGTTEGVHNCASFVKEFSKCVSNYGWRWAQMHMQLEAAQKAADAAQQQQSQPQE